MVIQQCAAMAISICSFGRRDIRRATELMIASGYQPRRAAACHRRRENSAVSFLPSRIQDAHRTSQRLYARYFPRLLPLERFFERQIRVQLDSARCPRYPWKMTGIDLCHGAKHLWER